MAGWNPDRPPLPGNWNSIHRLVLGIGRGRTRKRCALRFEGCTGLATEVDHIDDNGDHSLGNLRPVCEKCHRKRTQEQSREAIRKKFSRTKPRPRKHPGLL